MIKSFGLTCVISIFFVFTNAPLADQGIVATESGLAYIDLEDGTGPVAELGKIAVIHFIGWLDENGEKGKQFFSSRDRGEPVAFKLGTDGVMHGWNIGLIGMKAGGKRRLMIPYQLGYGADGVEDVVPPYSDLIFEIELIEVK